ncbi:ESPR-type extended signal peptide-containing protein [Caballeronia sp. ATUFL_M2_KS44]|uniref:ESPR-type extended signal peptide-containing protein n=1 Tax=Caballeronia sp. ATUFL_M2_KS44 TaxID=2921767 RepID=UPI00254095B5|nr:ESPR-type extended signal peptide-containing protein [Caballeronia sp. ATUFL_M2_KS44]
MNKSYRSIWNEKVGTFVAVAETTMARGKKSSGGAVCEAESPYEPSFVQRIGGPQKLMTGVGAAIALMCGSTSSFALTPFVAACANGVGNVMNSTTAASTASSTGVSCGSASSIPGIAGSSFTGIVLADDNAGGQTAWMTLGNGMLTMNANTKIQMNQYLDMTGHSIANLAAGAVNATSTDAVNGSQLFSMSNSLSTVVSSTSSSMSVSLSTMSSSMASLSSGWSSASTSLSTGMSSVSTGWNTASTSLSTGMSSVSTAWSSLSGSTSTSVNSISSTVVDWRKHDQQRGQFAVDGREHDHQHGQQPVHGPEHDEQRGQQPVHRTQHDQ